MLAPRTEEAQAARRKYEAACHEVEMSGGKTLPAYVPDGWEIARGLERELIQLQWDLDQIR